MQKWKKCAAPLRPRRGGPGAFKKAAKRCTELKRRVGPTLRNLGGYAIHTDHRLDAIQQLMFIERLGYETGDSRHDRKPAVLFRAVRTQHNRLKISSLKGFETPQLPHKGNAVDVRQGKIDDDQIGGHSGEKIQAFSRRGRRMHLSSVRFQEEPEDLQCIRVIINAHDLNSF
jgi:hypothetical protein